jgi:hypothetical protein
VEKEVLDAEMIIHQAMEEVESTAKETGIIA